MSVPSPDGSSRAIWTSSPCLVKSRCTARWLARSGGDGEAVGDQRVLQPVRIVRPSDEVDVDVGSRNVANEELERPAAPKSDCEALVSGHASHLGDDPYLRAGLLVHGWTLAPIPRSPDTSPSCQDGSRWTTSSRPTPTPTPQVSTTANRHRGDPREVKGYRRPSRLVFGAFCCKTLGRCESSAERSRSMRRLSWCRRS